MTDSKRKILFLIPSLVGGGAERTLINLLQKIDYDKYEVDLVSVLSKGIYLHQVPPQVQLTTLFKNELFVRVLAYLQKKIGFSFIFRNSIKTAIKNQYDVGISFLDGNFTDLLFFLPNIKKRVSWVHSSYKSNTNFYRFYKSKNYRKKLIKNRYGKLDKIVFVSKDALNEFEEVFGTFPSMEVIYNLIDSKAVIEKANLNNVERGEKTEFLAIGSLLRVKGYDRLIRAAAIVKSKGYDFILKIVGKGPEELALNNLIKENNMNETIKLVGFKPNPYPLLKNCDVFVMSSVSEALPTVLCEAMILGKPTLVTNCSGCRELIDDEKYGLMADQNDYALAKKMIMYLDNPNLLVHYALQSKARAEIFNDDEVLNGYYKIFES